MRLGLQAERLSAILKGVVYLATGVVAGAFLFVIGYILFKGLPYLELSLFSWEYTSSNVSMMPAIVNTLFLIGLTLLCAIPVGVGTAIYLTEYAQKGNRLVALIRLSTETLLGIPSIIYGLFGALCFVKFFGLGLSLIAGVFTLSIMVLPLIIRTTEEALLSVPDSYREGSFALGAGKLRTIFQVVLPSAFPGIFSGVILATGRMMGESAALIFTAGTVAEVASSLSSSARSLAVHMYVISGEGLSIHQTYATAVVLLGIVILINLLSEWVLTRLGGRHRE